MYCVTIGRSRHKAMIAEYLHAAENGADVVELRLDYIGRRSIDLKRLLENRPCPIVITCRRREDGGRWERSEEERLVVLRTAIATGVDFVDLEEDIASAIPRYGSTKRIISLHNFDETPEDLRSVHKRLSDLDADVIKIATMANSFTDSIRMLRLAESTELPTIAICMGDLGHITRVMALKNGAPFTYTVMKAGKKIAPGQITLEDMIKFYRPKEIDGDTQLFGVVADPVAHSLSPHVHNVAFQKSQLNCRYLPFRIPSDEIALFLQWCKEEEVGGISVTIPHKESAMTHLDEIEAAAKGIGAINTVSVRGMNAAGYNTDYRAAMDCLEEALKTQRTIQNVSEELREDDLFRGRGALVLGAGGAARAIGYGLRQRGALVAVSSRTAERAERLASDIGGRFLPWDSRYEINPGILVNCTPVGMHPDVDSTPYDGEKLNEEMIVFDTVYNPENTVLIKRAREAGCFVINGLDMFIRQAAYQFKLFTGLEPPIRDMRDTVKRITSPVKH
ncbi:MAG: shikimate dehydrogenase [Planctomycetota bacterium]